MRRNTAIFATLSLATAALIGGSVGAGEPTSPPTADHPATPVVDGTKIGKSRSNIQNNRPAAPPASQPGETAPDSKGVVKTKTKSNQSND
jgi:hypothetical protein